MRIRPGLDPRSAAEGPAVPSLLERQLLAARLARFRALIDAGMYRIDLDALASRIVDDDARARAVTASIPTSKVR